MSVQNRILLGLVALVLAGCTAARSRQPFLTSFLPPAAAPVVERGEITEPPPEIAANSYLSHETPNFIRREPSGPPGLTEPDRRMLRAEELFQEGRRLLEQGDPEGARREFDRALDLLLTTADNAPGRQRIEKKFEELVDRIHRYDLEALGAGEPDRVLTFEKAPLDEILDLTFPIDPKQKAKVREEVQAMASQLPLEATDPVLSYVNYFSTGRGLRTVLAGLRRAGRYRSLIARILDEEGLPGELIHLAQAESGFMPRAVSRKAAAGMWQFVKFRGHEYGLYQSAYHDDRLDPEKATRAAARHLRDLYQQFGDWYLAMAAYNCGPGAVARAVERTGYADFWELRSRNVLPRETANYVPAILAMIITVKNLKNGDTGAVDPDPPVEYDNIELAAPTHIALIADAADQPVSVIRELNPALLKNLAPAGYLLHVPKGTGSRVAAALEMVPQDRRNAWRLHRAGEGDSLALIAKRYGATVSALQAANNGAAIEAGDMVVVPVAARPESRAASRKAPASRSKTAARAPALRRAAAPARKPAASSAAGRSRTAVNVAQAASRRTAAAR